MSRLLAATGPTVAEHLDQFGELPSITAELVSAVSEAGLTGRGGAGFPTGRKMAAVAGTRPVVVGNGAEGEPLSSKDAELLTRAPHLVLDGLQAAAAAVGADRVYLYLHARTVAAVTAAVGERSDPLRVCLVEAPDRFVAGEESAVIRHIEGGPALPRDRTVVAAVSGVRGRPTLVNNVETLANIALIARYGSEWFRAVGDPEEPGTMLVTLSGFSHQGGVFEVPTGTMLSELAGLCGLLAQASGGHADELQAVLIGGYHGNWLSAGEFGASRLSRAALKPLGATPGAGIIHGLSHGECGLARVADIARYLADQSAGQCGPCLNGLPRLASLLDELAFGRASDHIVSEVRRVLRLVDGRGACRHPDGTVRMVRSALRTFAGDVELHRRRRCSAADLAG